MVKAFSLLSNDEEEDLEEDKSTGVPRENELYHDEFDETDDSNSEHLDDDTDRESTEPSTEETIK